MVTQSLSTPLTSDLVEHRVPVEHRVLGMDRRTFGLAAVALAIYLLWAWIVPRINDSIPYDDPIRVGDVVQVTDQVTMVPAVGWNLVEGLRTSDQTRSGDTASSNGVVLVGDGIYLQARPGPFDGTATQLLDQINVITASTQAKEDFRVVGPRRSVTTASGMPGVAEGYRTTQSIGVEAAFVADKGIQIQVVGSPDQMTQQSAVVYSMINSLTYTPEGSR